MNEINKEIIKHFKGFFDGHDFQLIKWELGPIEDVAPGFQIIQFSPGPKSNLWCYCSIGASSIEHEGSGIYEFMILSPIESNRLAEILAMITHYHANHKLGFGHTLPIGEPWIENSNCNNMLLSLPYPFGEELEIIPINNKHAHLIWLLPITDEEREFKVQNDLEALEQKFDDSKLEYWDIKRESVV